MTSISYSPVTIQASSQSMPSTPGWFVEATLIVHYLHKQGVLDAIAEHVRFARRRFGRYEVIDFVDEALYGFLPVENTRGQFPGPIPGKWLGSFAILKARCLRITENR
jgi:hypothetical protein